MTLSFLPEQIPHWPVDRLNPFARNAVINPSAVDAGIVPACDACRTRGQRRAVEGEVFRRLGKHGWAMLLICHDLGTSASATVGVHDVPPPGGAPVAGMG